MDSLLSLSASAGSGKTYQLTMRYLNLLWLNANPSSILTLTFTKKAAKEMEDRVLKSIEELYYNKSDTNTIKKYAFISINNSNNPKEIEEKITRIYHSVLKEKLRITTIDAFFQSVLKKFCWYVGISYDFEMLEDNIDEISEFFLNQLQKRDFNELVEICYRNKEGLNTILELCGMLDSFKEMLEKQHFIKQVYTKKRDYKQEALNYANALKESYFITKGKLAKSLNFETFEELLQQGKTWLTKDNINDYRDFKSIVFNPSDFTQCKDAILKDFKLDESIYLEQLYRIFECYLSAKEQYYKAHNCLSFNAVASKVYALLAQNLVSKDFLYFRLDSVISHILIDEFQDTSVLQYKILEPLINEIKSGVGQKNFERSFFYVGDVKQSIYRFRGGNPLLFNLASKGLKQETLDSNWRSAKEIVEFVNTIFEGKIEGFIQQIPQLNLEGYVGVIDSDDVYATLIENLQQLKSLGVKDESVTILTFKNKDVTELAQTLQEKGYKVVIDASAKLIQHNEVRAIIEMLHHITTQNIQHYYAFCMLLGLDNKKESLKVTQKSTNPSQIVFTIMQQYNIASLSAKKFLEATLSYPTLESLLENVEKINLDIVSSDFNGIRIMTIHKSKGLEFENVFILDSTKSKHNSAKILLSFKDNGVEIDEIFKNEKSDIKNLRESIDENYRNALSKEKELEKNDLKNQLYVALTRAKNTMHIIKTKQGVLDSLHLEARNYGNLENAIKAMKNQQNHTNTTEETFHQKAQSKKSLQNLGRQKEMQIGEDNDKKQKMQGFLGNINFGIALHFAMEQKIKHKMLDSLLLELLNNKFGYYFSKDTLQKIINQCNLVLKNSNFIEIISKGKVKCEVPFLSNNRQKRLDLLVENDTHVWIIDYKSGAINVKHNAQVSDYVTSIGKMLNKTTYGYVFYLFQEKLGEKGKLVQVI